MNKSDMRLALRAFKGCKRYLNTASQMRGRSLICFAINEWGNRSWPQRMGAAEAARIITMRSIRPWKTMAHWALATNNPANVQAIRHAFVDACITELERRIKA